MKKCFLVLVVALCVSFGVFASLPGVSGAYRGMPKLNSLYSEHFEIIYPDGLKDKADELHLKSEDVLKELEEYFGVKWNYGKIGVVLTDSHKLLNAYYSPYTSSHIIMYITKPDNGDLLNYSNTTASIFEHELAHYFIMKLHGSVMNGFSTVFGDYFCNGIFLPNFMVEGLSVAFESRNGEGRLNYPFSTFVLREAKRMQKFPHWRLLGGSLTTSPYKNLEYIAGGAFVAFLREQYGLSKFYSLINGFRNMFSFPHLFESVYGLSLDSAWQEFIARLPSSDDALSPSFLHNGQGRYQYLKYRSDTLYYIDIASNGVYSEKNGNRQKLASLDGSINSFDVSKDEKYFLFSIVYDNKAEVRVFECESKKHIATFENARHGGFAYFGVENVVLYTKDTEPRTLLISSRLDGSEIAKLELKKDSEVLAFSPFIKDHFAFVYKEGANVMLATSDKNFNKMLKFYIPELTVQGLSISHSQNEDEVCLSLSATLKENVFKTNLLPSILLFTFNKDGELLNVHISTKNVKGGMLFPILFDDDIFFVNTSFGYNTLSRIKKSDVEIIDISEKVEVIPIARYGEKENEIISDVVVFKEMGEKTYSRFVNALPFSHKGAFIPFVFYDKTSENYSILPSLSYYTSDFTETLASALHFAYRPYNNNVYGRQTKWFEINSILLEAGMNIDVLPFSIYLALRPKFYFDRLTGTSISLNGYAKAEYLHLFGSSYHYISTSLLLGYDKRLYGSLNLYEDGLYIDASVLYNNTHYQGYGYNQINGWRVGCDFSVSEIMMDKHRWAFDVSLYGRFYHSRIIPVQNRKNLTYNLPFNLTLKAEYKNVGMVEDLNREKVLHNNFIGLTPSLSVILFALDIENMLSYDIPITFNSFVLNAFTSFDYSFYSKQTQTVNHRLDITVGLESYITISPGFLGVAIQSAKLDLGVKYEMTWRSDSERNNAFYPLALYKYGKISFVCRTSVDI